MRRLLLCTLSVSALISTTAFAEEGQMHVKYNDLNLTSPAGAQEILYRIHHSALIFCDDIEGRATLSHRNDMIHGCVHTMTTLAVQRLDAPLVAALYENRSASTELATR